MYKKTCVKKNEVFERKVKRKINGPIKIEMRVGE
jgi:hypothetical protein